MTVDKAKILYELEMAGEADADINAQIDRLIAGAKSYIENLAGRKFFSGETVISQEHYKEPIIVKNSPFKELVVKVVDEDNQETTLTVDDDYWIKGNRVVMTNDHVYRKVITESKLDGEFLDVELICHEMVKRMYNKSDHAGETTSGGLNASATVWGDNITEEEMTVINSYVIAF